jgi:ribosomal protein L32
MNLERKACPTCKQEKDIIEIERVKGRETFKLSCGHKQNNYEFIGNISIGLIPQHKAEFWDKKKLQKISRSKTSGKTKRPAKESIVFYRDKKIIIHKVWEKNESGEWKLIHEHTEPFKTKKINS